MTWAPGRHRDWPYPKGPVVTTVINTVTLIAAALLVLSPAITALTTFLAVR